MLPKRHGRCVVLNHTMYGPEAPTARKVVKARRIELWTVFEHMAVRSISFK